MDHLVSAHERTAASSAIRDLLRLVERGDVRSLAGGLPAAEALGGLGGLVEEAVGRALTWRGAHGPVALQYGPTEGLEELRETVASRLTAAAPACLVTAGEVLVTTGSQQALDLVARAVLDPGDVAVVEAPTYLGALQALRRPGVRVDAMPGDAAGLDVDALAARLQAGLRPKLVYVVANFANPTGASLPLERRRSLASLADRYGFLVVEDDPYGELRFRGHPLAPVRAFGTNVVTLGSASKIIAPGLRVGWMVAPGAIAAAVARIKQAADLHTSSLSQVVVREVLGDRARLDAHVRWLVDLYGRRCRALHSALRKACPGLLHWSEPDGGMFLWATLSPQVPAGWDTGALLDRAIAEGVAFVPGAAFHVDPAAGRRQMRLSFASLDEAGLRDAARRLARALEGELGGELGGVRTLGRGAPMPA